MYSWTHCPPESCRAGGRCWISEEEDVGWEALPQQALWTPGYPSWDAWPLNPHPQSPVLSPIIFMSGRGGEHFPSATIQGSRPMGLPFFSLQERVPETGLIMLWGSGWKSLPPLLPERTTGSPLEEMLAPVRRVIGRLQAVQDPVHKLPILVLQLFQLCSSIGCLFQTVGSYL